MCENVCRHNKVTEEERDGAVFSPPPSMDSEYDECKRKIDASKERRSRTSITWKDEHLTFCICARAGTSQDFAETLMGMAPTLISNIYNAWGNMLCVSLVKIFPRPTHNQTLSDYPSRFCESNSDAKVEVLLDTFEVLTQSSENKNVAVNNHSDYKKHCTEKLFGTCDTIGYAGGGL